MAEERALAGQFVFSWAEMRLKEQGLTAEAGILSLVKK